MKIKQSHRGYIECMEKPYIFTYENDFLQLVPKNKEEINPFDCLLNTNKEYDILEGENTDGHKLYFLNCHLKASGADYLAKPAGFICCNSEMKSFKVITFSGGIINFFYRANQIFDESQSNINCDTGESFIKLKSFNETSKNYPIQIIDKSATLCLGISLPSLPEYMEIDYNLGKPRSFLRLIFEEEVDIDEFKDIYLWLNNFMGFLNFRKDISWGDIELGFLNPNGQVEKNAYAYLVKNKKSEIKNVDRTIGYIFVEKNLNQLIQIVNTPNLNLLFIPENDKAQQYVTSQDYMISCTSFESVFKLVFPNAKLEYSEMKNEVRDEFMDFIAEKDMEYKGKCARKRKEFKKYSDIITMLDFGLAEKFEYCYEKYKDIVGKHEKSRYEKAESVCIKEMARAFANKRNMFMHSNLEILEEIHIRAYFRIHVFIYIMIMSKAEIDDVMIEQAISKVLIH